MSTFLSQLELNPQVGQSDDDEDFEKDYVEREKEIKKLLESELNDDEFFEDDKSFASLHMSESAFESPLESYSQFYGFPHEGANDSRKGISDTGALLTSRGTDFLNRISSRNPIGTNSDSNIVNKVKGSLQRDSTEHEHVYFRDTNPLPASVDAAEGSPKVKNWENEMKNDSIVSKYYEYDREQSGFVDAFDENLQFDINDGGTEQAKGYMNGRSFDSFHEHFNDSSKNDSSYGTNNRVPINNESSNGLAISSIKGYSDVRTNSSYDEVSSKDLDNGIEDFDHTDNRQLRILYEVRGKKIEELQILLEKSKEKQASELRILQHKLALVSGERDGINTSYMQIQELVREERDRGAQLERKLLEEQTANRKLDSERIELAEKLEISESTIESLNQQITSLSHAESLSRLRANHEVIMSTARKRHEEEILRLKEKLDDSKKELSWKTEDVNRLQDELQAARKFADQTKIESADTINQLSRSLEATQRHLRDILDEGKLDEAGKTRWLLKEEVKNKNVLEAENKGLKEEVNELKEQLGMYEVLLESTTLGPSSSTPFTEQNVNSKLHEFGMFKTPISRLGRHSSLGNSPIGSIRDELVKSLANNKKKRDEIENARRKIDSLQAELESLTKENTQLENAIKNFEIEKDMVEKVDKAVAVKLVEDEESILDMQSKLRDATEKIGEIESAHCHLKNENASLKSEISRMMQDFDNDKIEAMRNCEKTYMQLNEDAKRSLEKRLVEEHQAGLEILRNETDNLRNELFDVKESYIALMNENKELENQVRAQCEKETLHRLNEARIALTEAHKEELRQLEEELSSQHWVQLEDERKKIKDSFKNESNQKIQTGIALAKVEWFAAYETEKTNAVEIAVESAKLKVIHDKDLEIKNLTSKLKKEFENEKQVAISEFKKANHLDVQYEIDEGVDEAKTKQSNEEKERIIAMVVKELGVSEHDSGGHAVVFAIQSLKQEIVKYKKEIERLEYDAVNTKNDLVIEIEAKCSEKINNAISEAKSIWLKEKSGLIQEMLKEESQRIRRELLLDFTEEDGMGRSESEIEHEEDIYSELREFIKCLKGIYSKKLQDLKDTMDDKSKMWKKEQEEVAEKQLKEKTEYLAQKSEEEKQIVVSSTNEKWEKFMKNLKREQEEMYAGRLAKELERAKGGWKRDLEELQKEHEAVLRETVSDMQSQRDAEQTELKKAFNEFIRKMKKEFSEKLEKQKSDLEEYHSNLTKKTLLLAKKEWHLQTSYQDNSSRQFDKSNRSQKLVFNSIPVSNSEGLAEQYSDLRSNNSDSGITSPKTVHVSTPKIAVNSSNETLDGESSSLTVQATRKHLSVQTDSGEDNTLSLQDMRKYYLETVNEIKEDVFKHVKKTKINAALYFKKQITKEKKLLVDKIRRKFLTVLKENHSSKLESETEMALLQVLKDADFEENSLTAEHEKVLGENLHSQNRINEPQTFAKSQVETKIGVDKGIERGTHSMKSVMESDRLSKASSKRTQKVKHSSPSTSIISCDSNGTFYTDLPSALAATPCHDQP